MSKIKKDKMDIQVDFVWSEFWNSEWGQAVKEHADYSGRSIGGGSIGKEGKQKMDKIEKYLLDQKQKWLEKQGFDFNKQSFEITNKEPIK